MNEPVLPSLNNNLGVLGHKLSVSGNVGGEEWIDMNQVLRQSLQKNASGGIKEQLILRIDPLPLVRCNAQQYTVMLDALVQMIVLQPPVNSKLYLYIKCEEEKIDTPDVKRKSPIYKISFYTNIVTDEHWKKLYRNKLIEYSNTFTDKERIFSFHEISNSGCLFSINLPGKIR